MDQPYLFDSVDSFDSYDSYDSFDTFDAPAENIHEPLAQEQQTAPSMSRFFLYLAITLLPILVFALYHLLSTSLPARLPSLRNKRICLLIAHPDDEAMFFSPTLLALTRPETGNHVKILCLSTGNAEGLGETRKKELIKSGMLLGLRREDDVFVLDRADFPDSMTATWDPSRIASLLFDGFAPHLSSPSKPKGSRTPSPPPPSIDVLITFDADGVSSHPNHIALYHGAKAFLKQLALRPQGPPMVDLYTLTSVGMARKYISALDGIATLGMNWGLLDQAKSPAEGEGAGEREDEEDERRPDGLVFLNKLSGEGAVINTAWKAMTTAHKSQMVWFRYGWIGFSRYMLMNDLKRVKV